MEQVLSRSASDPADQGYYYQLLIKIQFGNARKHWLYKASTRVIFNCWEKVSNFNGRKSGWRKQKKEIQLRDFSHALILRCSAHHVREQSTSSKGSSFRISFCLFWKIYSSYSRFWMTLRRQFWGSRCFSLALLFLLSSWRFVQSFYIWMGSSWESFQVLLFI